MDPLTLFALTLAPFILMRRASSSIKTNLYKSNPNLPEGRGLFFRSLTRAKSKEDFLNDIRILKLNWLAVQTHWQNDDHKTLFYLDDIQLSWLQEAKNKYPSLGIWFLAYPNIWNIDEFIEICLKYENYKMCSGYILDVEKPYLNEPEWAKYLVDQVKLNFRKPVGLTSYGGGDVFIEGFPWDIFSRLDFGMPQIYDMNLNMGPTYPKISFNSWSKYFKEIIPLWLAGGETHSIEDMKKISNNTPKGMGYGWWDYKWVKQRKDVYEFIKLYKK